GVAMQCIARPTDALAGRAGKTSPQKTQRAPRTKDAGNLPYPSFSAPSASPAVSALDAQHAVDDLDEVPLRLEPDDALLRLVAAFEDEHLRDAGDAVLHSEVGVVVGVELTDLDLAGELVGELVDRGRQRPARPAPGRPKVHQDGDFTLD